VGVVGHQGEVGDTGGRRHQARIHSSMLVRDQPRIGECGDVGGPESTASMSASSWEAYPFGVGQWRHRDVANTESVPCFSTHCHRKPLAVRYRCGVRQKGTSHSILTTGTAIRQWMSPESWTTAHRSRPRRRAEPPGLPLLRAELLEAPRSYMDRSARSYRPRPTSPEMATLPPAVCTSSNA